MVLGGGTTGGGCADEWEGLERVDKDGISVFLSSASGCRRSELGWDFDWFFVHTGWVLFLLGFSLQQGGGFHWVFSGCGVLNVSPT